MKNRLIINVFDYINVIRKYRTEKIKSEDYPVKFFNFWEQEICNMWFYRFIQSRELLKDKPNLSISFFSTFGKRTAIDWNNSEIKIFFTGENVQNGSNTLYADHALNNQKISLSMGFEHLVHNSYLRFPLWILYMFTPDSTEEDIISRCNELAHPQFKKKVKFAAHVARYDHLGIRAEICNALMKIEKVDCDGIFMHNNDDLKIKFNDNKHNYLNDYKFNICPENSNLNGYVTEKLFQAIDSGCVPVYWGSDNNPEPDILNQDAILFWDKGGNNDNIINFIKELNSKPKLFSDFTNQPRLSHAAAEFVIDKFSTLEKKIKKNIELEI